MAEIHKFFNYVIENSASDLHLCAGTKPRVRVFGDLEETAFDALSNDALKVLLFEIISNEQRKIFLENKELDFAYELPGKARFRANYFEQRHGVGAVFRLIPTEVPTIQDLGLPRQILKFTSLSRGLILITGPTGSGKSTTLAALIEHINSQSKLHVITIEDPIEYVHENKICLINQREVGSNTSSFANALRASLREDPDVILVGEMRDLETMELAITAAETGHLVFATLHTSSAMSTVDRIIDTFPEKQQAQIRTMLSTSLKGVLCQQLLRRTDKPGRVAAAEILFCSFAVANLIRESKTHQIPSVIQAGQGQGMQLMDHAILELLNKHIISSEDAYLKANEKKDFEKFLKFDEKKHLAGSIM